MACRQHPQPKTVADERDMEGQRFDPALREIEAAVKQRGGGLGTQRGLVAGEVVRMSVGNEGTWFCILWIQPQVEFREVQAALETNFNQWVNR